MEGRVEEDDVLDEEEEDEVEDEAEEEKEENADDVTVEVERAYFCL